MALLELPLATELFLGPLGDTEKGQGESPAAPWFRV